MEAMNEMIQLLPALAAGLVLGAIYFGGLWWTVNKGMKTSRAELWFAGSLLIRLGLAGAGFYYIAEGGWKPLLVSLLGFLLARQAAVWLAKTSPKKEVHYEDQPR